jgi:DNA-binding transcriptional LysR family regulator
MAKSPSWESRIGRRVRLRDLHVLFAVVQAGSMAKAGPHLGMSQSAVSQAITSLEHALGVPLFDRTPRGVELTIYGSALMRRGQAAFDELRSGVREIEHLTNPEIGEVRIACSESMAAGVVPSVIERFSRQYPRIKLHVFETTPHVMGFALLQERGVDVVLTLLPRPFESDLTEHLQSEVLFHERICLAAGTRSPWARRRKISLKHLVGATLISPPPDTPGGAAVVEAFRAAGLPVPQIAVTTFSVHLRNILGARGRFVAMLPVSVLRFNPGVYSLKELPLDLPIPRLPALMVTLKNRTLSPVVERFMACARDVVGAMGTPSPTPVSGKHLEPRPSSMRPSPAG